MAGLRKDVDLIVKKLERMGCRVTTTKAGHWRIYKDGCQALTMAKSPSDQKCLHRIRQDLRMYFGITL